MPRAHPAYLKPAAAAVCAMAVILVVVGCGTPTAGSSSPASSSVPTQTTPSDVARTSGSSSFGEYLSKIRPTNVARYNIDGVSIDGQRYPETVIPYLPQDNRWIAEYDIGGKYRIFTAILGNQDAAPEDKEPTTCVWRVLVDQPERVLVNESTSRRGQPVRVSGDISGAIHLRIEAVRTSGGRNTGNVFQACVIADAELR